VLTPRQRLFTAFGRYAHRLPKVRGRNRVFLELFKILGLANHHTYITADLPSPVPYRVRLDLHSWLQRIAFLAGEYEADTTRHLIRLHQLSGPGYFLDVGANIGLISVP
jgi:hypothetical protein